MSAILRISEASSLAMHAMALLASRPGERMSTARIAEVLRASEAHMSKVMQRLAKAGLVEAVRGPGGGFLLARPAGEVTLMQVYEAIDGELAPSDCLLGKPICSGTGCILGGLVKSVNREVRQHLRKTRLAELAKVYRSE